MPIGWGGQITQGGTTATTPATTTTPAPYNWTNNMNWQNSISYASGGGNAVAGGGSGNAQVTYIKDGTGEVDPTTGLRTNGGARYGLVDPTTNLPVFYGSDQNTWANVYAYAQQNGGQLPWVDQTGGSGGSGGYGYGGGGGGETKAYPQFDYNQAQGLWNTYITRNGFGAQDRQGDWARNYYNQSLSDFNSYWAKKHPPQEIPKEGTTDLPDVAQTSDYNRYLKRAFGDESLMDIYSSLAGARRGDNYNRFAGSGRTLSWG